MCGYNIEILTNSLEICEITELRVILNCKHIKFELRVEQKKSLASRGA